MEIHSTKTSFGSRFSQIAWVVSDIQAAEKFFRDVIGVPDFVKMENLRSEDLEGKYYDNSASYSFHLYMAYSGETLIELIQPVSGQSIFQDYLIKHPDGGVQHIAYMVPEADLDKAISELTALFIFKVPIRLVSTVTFPSSSVGRVKTLPTSRQQRLFFNK